MAQFDRAIVTAERLITKYGESVTWRRINDPVNASEPWKPGAATYTDVTVTICFVPLKRIDFETLRLKDQSEVPEGYVRGLMAQQSFEPTIKDVIIRSSNQLTVECINELSPNGQKILYTILFKQ